MAIIDSIFAKAKSNVKHIVLPEGEETRNIQAAAKVVKEGIAKITVLGDPEKVKAAGHPLVTMMVVTDDNGFENLAFKNGIDVKAGATTIGSIG